MQTVIPAVLLVVLVSSGCSGKNMLFGDASAHAVESERVVWAFFDRGGDLYPAPSVPVAVDDRTMQTNSLFLQRTYERGPDAEPWTTVREALGFTSDASWDSVQQALARRTAARIDALTRREGQARRPLVLLIHGFNVPDSEASYSKVRDTIDPLLPDAVYFQVSWDGLRAGFPPAVWAKAQYNFPQVGYGLRHVLNRIDPATPVRVFTHSSGGPVAAHALWDASRAYGNTLCSSSPRPGREEFQARVCSRTSPPPGPAPPRLADLRLGMIVPATNAGIFFEYDARESPVERIVLGVNPDDMAVGRFGVQTVFDWYKPSCRIQFPGRYAGDVCLAVDPDYVCGRTVTALRDSSNIDISVFDFSKSTVNKPVGVLGVELADSHDWTAYLQRDDYPAFLRALLSDEPVQDETAAFCEGYPLANPPGE